MQEESMDNDHIRSVYLYTCVLVIVSCQVTIGMTCPCSNATPTLTAAQKGEDESEENSGLNREQNINAFNAIIHMILDMRKNK